MSSHRNLKIKLQTYEPKFTFKEENVTPRELLVCNTPKNFLVLYVVAFYQRQESYPEKGFTNKLHGHQYVGFFCIDLTTLTFDLY